MFRHAPAAALFVLVFTLQARSQEGEKPAPEAPVKPPEEVLPRPLRRFDENKDGKLTGEELTLARQAHNRGGRAAQPDEGQWRETLDRFKNDWRRRRMEELDLDKNGELDEAERKRMNEVWREIADGITAARREITKKYDENDDGELNDQERRNSRRESESRRRAVEEAAMAKLKTPEAAEAAPEEKKTADPGS